MGRSIGSGPACYLASHHFTGGLFLITPFTSIKDTVKSIYGGVAASLVKERFENKKWIQSCKCPVLFIHGVEDKIVPYQHSKELYDLCNTPCEIVIFKNMSHQCFDISGCVMTPLLDFMRKLKVDFYHHETEIVFPRYLFYNPRQF